MHARDALIELAGRPAQAARALHDQLTEETLNCHPGGHPNSPAWLLWHSGREIDAQLSDLTGSAQIWTSRGFSERSGLGELGDSLGLGHTPAQARAVSVPGPGLLLEYLDAATEALCDHLRSLDDSALDEVIDESWDPPVTRGVRLASMIDDAAQHVGQAAYAAGARET